MIYRPTQPPKDAKDLSAWLIQEHQRISEALSIGADWMLLVSQERAPAKPRDGMIVLANGAWNPGAGAGYYGYRSGAWRFLG